MDQWVKALDAKSGNPKFSAWNSHDGRKNQTPENGPLTSHVCHCMCVRAYTHTLDKGNF